ncbi:p21-carboxy-terminal region-binding [Chlorella sorokiniana]|uniref:P21-carboxy-terminal region-binding n=1 Tax=Chlorella sorokiniana TaxID=3076 RepID=A0A2P6TX99_CHLSO|nr:p21-carboxy-terminal region-binding [Chlorella sorokiniana]|eukprot:PRW58681.1 p21-carboxy-terminal region-binding [Chlorella sorokiniana]
MPKRKQQAPPSSESEEPEASGEEPATSDSSSDDGDEFPSGADDSSSESSDDEAGEAFEQIDVDFGFFCPQEKDFHGLRTLLQGYLDGQQWACSELADAIIQQGDSVGVGSVIKCGEEDDPIGVSTVLPLGRHGGAKPLQELRAFLLAAAGDCRQRLEQAWAAPGTGLVINERLVNCPPELAEPLQESLYGEVAEAAEDEELPKAEREQFQLKRFLMVVRAYSDPSQQPDAAGSSGSGSKQQGKKKKQKGAAAAAESSGVVHFLPEAECYQAAADWSFTFPAADRLVGKDELQPCRCVMLVSAKGAAAARKQLAALMKAAAQ